MALEIDDEIIDWALKTVRKNRVDFSNWTDEDFSQCLKTKFWLGLVMMDNGKWYLDKELMAAHVVSLIGAVPSVSYLSNDRYETIVRKYWFEKVKQPKQLKKRDRGAAVLYGLLLYALRRTGYKHYLTDDEECLTLTDDEEKRLKELLLSEGAYLTNSSFADVKQLVVRGRWYENYLNPMYESLCPLLMALARGGDFPAPPIDCKDMPLEFVIESVKASVQES